MLATFARTSRLTARRYAHSAAASKLLEKRADDIVITFAKRSVLGRAKKGQLKDTSVDELLSAMFKVH